MLKIKLNKTQPINKNYIFIKDINGFSIGIIHKNNILKVLKRMEGLKC